MIKNKKQLLSIIVSFLVFTWFINWKFALTFVLGIGLHECGHLWMASKLGYSTQGFYLIPFFGGISSVSETAKSYKDLALIKIMGPVYGFSLALITAFIGKLFNNQIILSAAFIMIIWNAFNMIPLGFLDGAGIAESLLISVNKTLCLFVMFALHGAFLAIAAKYTSTLFFIIVVLLSVNYLKQLKDSIYSEKQIPTLTRLQTFHTLALLLVISGMGLLAFSIAYQPQIQFDKQIEPLLQ